MVDNKLSPQLQLALRFENLLNDDFKSLFISTQEPEIWEVMMTYTGSLETIRGDYSLTAYDLQSGFAQIFVEKDLIERLTNNPNIIYLALPTRYEYIDIGLSEVCASNIGGGNAVVGGTGQYNVTGDGVLLAIIDSGIDYSHPDFINEDGTSRIRYLWDQTLEGTPPEGYAYGQAFNQQEIEAALAETTDEARQAIVPSRDTLGHGTALAGVAAGNGRGSNGNTNRGIAPTCDLLVVKLGRPNTPAPTDLEVMQGISYTIERAKELGLPVTVLIGVGSNLTEHDGRSLLEQYINVRYESWYCNFVVGTGNEGNTGAHASGKLQQGETQTVELLVERDKVSYSCCIWRSFSDSISLVIEAPNGEVTDELSILTPNRAYLFDQTAVLVNFVEPANNIDFQVIFILFQGQGGAGINQGVWRFRLTGDDILMGNYNIWGSVVKEPGDLTRFLVATLDVTLTSPSTGEKITSVSAYNGRTMQIAPFSGRGYTLSGRIKPDLAAPGVSVTVPAAHSQSLYKTLSGTSVASAFVAGAYVLLLSYGILQLGNINLYGDILKIYLLRSTRKSASKGPYPNQSWGYGTLCIEAALRLMEELNNQSS